jgi:amino acid transporter
LHVLDYLKKEILEVKMSPNYGSMRLVSKVMKFLSIFGLIITLLLSGILFYLGFSGDQTLLSNLGLGLYFLMAGNTGILIIGAVILAFGLVVSLVFFALGAVLETLASVDENTRYFLMTLQQDGTTQPTRVPK